MACRSACISRAATVRRLLCWRSPRSSRRRNRGWIGCQDCKELPQFCGVKFYGDGNPDGADDLTGLLVFSVLALRTLLILCIGSLDRSLVARRITCAATFAVCVVCTIAAQYIGVYPFRLIALLPAIGIGFGCLGEASDDTVVRRRCILGLGSILAVFAFETSAWGLLFKNLLSDAGASAYSMVKYRDPPPWAPFSRGQPVHRDAVTSERQGSTETFAEPPLSRGADLGGTLTEH
jgi:hypothetical protein